MDMRMDMHMDMLMDMHMNMHISMCIGMRICVFFRDVYRRVRRPTNNGSGPNLFVLTSGSLRSHATTIQR